MSRIYERELKGILAGEKALLQKVTRTCTLEERDAYFSILKKPFFVIRSAGSLQVDLLAMRGDYSFPIEVKSSKHAVVRFSRSEQLQQQAEKLLFECTRANLVPVYAFRLKSSKGDHWRIFRMEMERPPKGTASILYRRLPTLRRTKAGYRVLDFKLGMPLNRFIDYLCR